MGAIRPIETGEQADSNIRVAIELAKRALRLLEDVPDTGSSWEAKLSLANAIANMKHAQAGR